jgi:hypothetical protein
MSTHSATRAGVLPGINTDVIEMVLVTVIAVVVGSHIGRLIAWATLN